MPRTSPYEIVLSPAEDVYLRQVSRKYTAPYYVVTRAKIILLAAEGKQNKQISERLDVPVQIVSKWRKRFFLERVAGLEDQSGRGRPRVFSPSDRHGSKSSGL